MHVNKFTASKESLLYRTLLFNHQKVNIFSYVCYVHILPPFKREYLYTLPQADNITRMKSDQPFIFISWRRHNGNKQLHNIYIHIYIYVEQKIWDHTVFMKF